MRLLIDSWIEYATLREKKQGRVGFFHYLGMISAELPLFRQINPYYSGKKLQIRGFYDLTDVVQ
jgi:hypothetical protein